MLKALDAVAGRALCWVLPLFARHGGEASSRSAPERVLVIRPGGIGDAVLFLPMLRALRHEWPRCQLDLLVEARNAGVVRQTDLADRVLRYDRPLSDLRATLRTRYDLVIDTEQYHRLSAVVALLTGAPQRIGFGTNSRRRLLTATIAYDQKLYEAYSFLQLARLVTGREPEWNRELPFYDVSPAALQFADDKLAPLHSRVCVAIHPGASIPERRWPPERYAVLARMLAQQGVGIVILGGPSDGRAASVIADHLEGHPHVNLAKACDLMQAAAVVSRASVYVSADSGVLHLAYGVGTPTVHLFGPGVLSKWGPPGSKFRVVAVSLPCSPCTRFGFTPPCCQGLRCMLGITPRHVYEAVRDQLAKQGHRVPAAELIQ
ncbi:MAG: glycosyltransferase family 9 protein [Acidobacteriota bacterium]|nr:MAG: glycosyltransferase family 9 protein [Acidobacteriota bacterium]